MRFFQFKIIIHFLVSFFRFILIAMLLVYNHYTYLNSFSAGTVWQILTYKDGPRAERVNSLGDLMKVKMTVIAHRRRSYGTGDAAVSLTFSFRVLF